MITLNGKNFAETDSEFSSHNCVGFAKRNSKSITLTDKNKNKIGVINCHGVLCRADKLDNGSWWYSYGDIDLIGRYDSYMQEREEIRVAMKGY